jgi:hypothetical protein
MPYQGEGRGERGPGPNTWVGHSQVKFENAINAAVHASGCAHGTVFNVTKWQVTTIGDPQVGGYTVELTQAG